MAVSNRYHISLNCFVWVILFINLNFMHSRIYADLMPQAFSDSHSVSEFTSFMYTIVEINYIVNFRQDCVLLIFMIALMTTLKFYFCIWVGSQTNASCKKKIGLLRKRHAIYNIC